MVSMSKEEMVQYLHDYACTLDVMMHNKNITVGEAFTYNMKSSFRLQDNTVEYFDRMRKVYSLYIYFKKISFFEDFLLNRDDYLSNNDLDNLLDGVTIKNVPLGTTNKRVIQLIRDAFNHNDSPLIDRFKISKSARSVEISFKDIRKEKEKGSTPKKPFSLKLDAEYLAKIIGMMALNKQNVIFFSYSIPDDFNIYAKDLYSELDKIKIIRYYFIKKIPKDAMKEFSRLADTKNLTDEELIARSDEMHNYAKKYAEPTLFGLDDIQKKKMLFYIQRLKQMFGEENIDYNATPYDGVLYHFLNKIVPVPLLKDFDLDDQLLLSAGLLGNTDFTFEHFYNKLYEILNNKLIKNDDFDARIIEGLKEGKKIRILKLMYNISDGEFVQAQPAIMYIDSVIMHCCDSEEIIIDGITYNKEKIRNSFAHGRWYIGLNNKIMMYDADPRNINDYNLEFIGEISLSSFFAWAENYMATKQTKKMNR